MSKILNNKIPSRSLILHIGFPKTGTTMIQEFLKASCKQFEANGVGVLSVEGDGAHHHLGGYIIALDKPELREDGWFLGMHNQIDFFPKWRNHSRYLISSETMSVVGKLGVQSVVRYARESDALVKVAVTLRKPSEWLLSCWTQHVKTSYIDWIDYVLWATEKKHGFLSSSLQPWLIRNKIDSIVIIKYEKKELLKGFLRRVGMEQFSPSDDDVAPIINSGRDIIEVLYYAAAVKDVHRILASSDRFSFVKPDWGYVKRMLLDVADIASPAFEVAQKYSDDFDNNSSFLGSDSNQSLARYLKEWAEDAEQFLQLANEWLDEESIRIIQKLAIEALDEVRILNEAPETYHKLPQKNFVEKLPIDSQFIGQTRVLAASILLGCRAYLQLTSQHGGS